MKLKHFDHDGRARFVTFCTHRKIPLLTNNRFRKVIVETLQELREEERFRLLGYVIMPEHVHLVIVPHIDSEIGYIIGEIKRRSAIRIHEILITENSTLLPRLTIVRNRVERFAVWQRRCYDHNCRTDEKIWEKVNYCHMNPVKRGLVASPDRWEWSSYKWYQGKSNPILEMDIAD